VGGPGRRLEYDRGVRRLRSLAAGVLVIGALAGCGADDGEEAAVTSGDAEQTTTEAPADTTTADTTATDGALTAEDEEAITETIRAWLTEGGCERMTDDFLEDQTFIEDPEEACETFEQGFTEPAYGPEDVIVSEISGTAEKAKATVGDEVTDIESRYTLVKDDGQWKIDAAGF